MADTTEPPPPIRSLKRRRIDNDASSPLTASRPSPSKRQYFGPCHLLNLPHEILLSILCHLSPPNLLKLSTCSHKLNILASDSQVWKSLFYKRFVVPRLSERHRQHRHLVQRTSASLSTDIKGGTYGGSSGSGNTVPPLAKEWNLWLDDYILLQKEREIVRDIARTREEVLQDDQIKELSSANYQKVGMDWKAKYRLRHNWYRGSSTRTRLCDSDLPSLRLPPFGRWMGSLDWGEVIKTRYHNGWIFTAYARGLVIRSTKKIGANEESAVIPYYLNETNLSVEDQSRDWISCMVLEESLSTDSTQALQKEYGIDIVLATRMRQVIILNFSPTKMTITTKSQEIFPDKSEVTTSNVPNLILQMSYCRPYLVFATRMGNLFVYSYHASMSFAENRLYARPLLVTNLTNLTTPVHKDCLFIRQAESDGDEAKRTTYVVTIVQHENDHVFMHARVGLQELHIDPRTHKVFLSRLSTMDDASTHSLRPLRREYSWCLSISYKYPYIVTSHKNNTLTLYTVNSPYAPPPPTDLLSKKPLSLPTTTPTPTLTDTTTTTDNTKPYNPRPLTISSGYSMWGHCASVTSVQINSKRAVSIDSMGEIRIWNFWRNISGLLQRSVLVKGTNPKDPDQSKKDWQVVGFGEEEIVVDCRKMRDGSEFYMNSRTIDYDRNAEKEEEQWLDVHDFS